MRTRAVILIGLAFTASSDCLHSTHATPAPTACLTGAERLYDRYEGTGEPNACRSDADCATSGCSGEVCAAVRLVTTCELIPTPRGDFGCRGCGCVSGTCLWIR